MLVMFLDCYSNTSVLVTGHTGFKGTWLSLWLHSLGAHVIGYSMKPPTTPNLFEACGLEEHIQHFEGDIRDTMAISEVVAIHKPKFIFHLAALPLVRDSYSSPRETFDTNVMGTISVLDALRTNTNPCSVVVVSTDKCYANASWEYGYRETDTLGGHDPYSASKAAMELAVSSYRQSFFSPDVVGEHNVRVSSARAGNVIGGGDWSQDRIVPDAIRALAEERKLKVRSPRAVRPWQHVLEPLSGYLWLAASMSRDEGGRLASSWNFGPLPSETYTVAALVDRIIAAWGRGEWVEQG
jgi:CDP-glucose 4,6-dehydratase